MARELKFVDASLSIGFKGGIVQLRQDEAWDASDPFVQAHPELFCDEPRTVRGSNAPSSLDHDQPQVGKPHMATAQDRTPRSKR